MNAMHHLIDWPEGVLLRALTRNGAPIDVTVSGRRGVRLHHAECGGCGRDKDTPVSHTGGILPVLLVWVDEHADTCRFLPRPDTDTSRK